MDLTFKPCRDKIVRPFFNHSESKGFTGTKYNNNMFLEKHWAYLLKSPKSHESQHHVWFMMQF